MTRSAFKNTKFVHVSQRVLEPHNLKPKSNPDVRTTFESSSSSLP